MNAPVPERIFIEIAPAGTARTGYRGRIHRGDRDRGVELESLDLGPDSAPFPKRSHTLGALVERLATLDEAFARELDERFQTEIGMHLYAQTLGRVDAWDLPDEGDVEVQIVTLDEHIARLPWVLLNRRGGAFLSACGWSISLARSAEDQKDCELQPSPRMLIVAPEPPGWPPTQAAEHLDELEEMLGEADPRFKRNQHLKVVRGWDEIAPALASFQPHLLYYYGHGKGGMATSRLVFSSPSALEQTVPVADLAQLLRHSSAPLLLAYVNCCQGDAGGLLGAGWQLGEFVPAVVTNRTVAYVSTARAQALELWRSILLLGDPPHQALATLHARIETPGHTFANTRWMNPVLHRRYARWTSSPPRPRSRMKHDPHWNVKLDRSKQFRQVFTDTEQMLREGSPRVLAYVWYGEEGQGVGLFHQRLQVELQERLERAWILKIEPRWPEELLNRYRSFEDMIAEACDLRDISQLDAWIRANSQGDRRTTPLFHVRHEPLRPGEPVKPSDLRIYLEWWNDYLVPILVDARAFGLLGISFLAQKDPAKLAKRLREAFKDLELEHVVHDVLDELEKIDLEDLKRFLRFYRVLLPRSMKERVLGRILERSGGRYEMTVEELRKLVDQAWEDDEILSEPAAQPADEEDDW
ncbi:MAG: hypothetical protein ABUT39_26255 [Acidobacteriota bacterium]